MKMRLVKINGTFLVDCGYHFTSINEFGLKYISSIGSIQ